MDYVHAIEEASGREAVKEFLPLQPGDALATNADITLDAWVALNRTPLLKGVLKFVEWYRDYYNV